MILNLFALSGAVIAISSGIMTVVMFSFGKTFLHRLWGVFCVSVFIWGLGGFFIGITHNVALASIWWRVAHIGIAFIPTLFLHFVYVFLEEKREKTLFVFYFISCLFAFLALFTNLLVAHMTFVFGEFYYDSPPGILYPVFTVYFFGLIIYSHYVLYKAYKQEKVVDSETDIKRTRILYFFLGMLISFAGGGLSFLPVYGVDLYPVANFAVLLYPIIIGYAILRHNLFNIRVALAQGLIFLLWIFVGVRFALSSSVQELLINGILFIAVVLLGIFLVRSIGQEIKTREKIQEQEKALEIANNQQVVLIHFITHQIKGFLTKSRNIFSMALEGDFGTLPKEFIPMAEEGLRSGTQGVTTVQEILNAANVKSGAIKYAVESFDISVLLEEIVNSFQSVAHTKGIALTSNIETGLPAFTGDRLQLQNAFRNLIDNSIKYTPSGSVEVSLKRENETLRLLIADTGVGITEEDMSHLFTEGGHGKDSIKINVESTGFGLYIVKNIIEAHHGKVWAESDGPGKGSRFNIELPLEQPAQGGEHNLT